MITKEFTDSIPAFPFVYHFAQRLPEMPHHRLRYDTARQVSQVLVDGRWVDSPNASVALTSSTRFTRVPGETTDDE